MDAVALLDATIEALTSDSIFDLDDHEIAERLITLGRFKARLAAHEADMTAAFDTDGLCRHDGSRTTVVWLIGNCGMSRAAAAAQVRLARRLRTMPATAAALAAGEITVEHALRLGMLAQSPRRVVREAFADAEATLVAQACTLLHSEFEQMARYWEDLVDPDGTESTAEDDYNARRLHASELLRGMVRLDGTLDPVGGAIFLGELVRIEQAMFDTDWAAARTEHGDDTSAEDLSRTPQQRRADALQEMARRSANHEPAKDSDGEARPLFVVHIGPDIPARMCELASGTVIAPGLLVPHLGEADIERIIYGPESRVLDLSKRDRFFRGALRRAIQHRDRRCSHPGCDIPAQHCQVDHIKPRSHGGETTLENGRLYCGYNNRWAYNHQQRHTHHNPNTPGPDPPDTS